MKLNEAGGERDGGWGKAKGRINDPTAYVRYVGNAHGPHSCGNWAGVWMAITRSVLLVISLDVEDENDEEQIVAVFGVSAATRNNASKFSMTC